METTNDWYEGIAKQINSLKDSLTKKDYQSYKLDCLKRVAHKVANLSPECNDCRNIQDTITEMVATLADSPQMSTEQKRDYIETMRSVIKHLEGHAAAQWQWSSNIKLIIGLSLILIGLLIVLIGFAQWYDGGSMRYLQEQMMVIFSSLMLIIGGLILLLMHSRKL